MRRQSICIMTSVHRHDDVRIYHKEAKALQRHGYAVTVLCPDFEGIDEEGIRFVKIPLPQSRGKRIIRAPVLFAKKAEELRADVYHFHDPELILTGLKLRKKAKVIYDIHEDVPRQILTKPYLHPLVAKIASGFMQWYEEAAASKFFAVVAAEPVIYERLKKSNRNTRLVCNFPILEEFQNLKKTEIKGNTVCYLGGITKIRGLFSMLSAVENTDIKLILAGDFETEELKREAEAHKGYQNVEYKGFLNREGVKKLLQEVGAGLVTLHPIPKYLTALPVKMFEYMAAEVPVISSDFPYWKEIVKDADCGICVDPRNPSEIQKAVLYLSEHPEEAKRMGENGRKKVFEKYNWDIEKKKLIALYESIKKERDS